VAEGKIQLLDHAGRPITRPETVAGWADLAKASGAPLRHQEVERQRLWRGPGVSKGMGSRISFETLRILSVAYPVARACIWRRIRQALAVDWEITPREGAKISDAAAAEAKEFFSTHGGLGGPGMRVRHFISSVLEDLLVLDAVVLYRLPTRGKKTHSLLLVAPETIRILADEKGWLPLPPDPAYKQYIQGREMGSWSSQEMRYEMMNPRSITPYGLAPLECLVTIVEAAIRSELWNLEWFTSGNLPEGLILMPKDWTPEQGREFMTYWDSTLQGDVGKRQTIRLAPETGFKEFKGRGDMQFERLQSWLAALTCAIFDINPTTIGLSAQVYKYAQEGQIDIARLWGLQPLLQFLKELFDDILATDLEMPEMEFRFSDLEEEDALAVAQTNDLLLGKVKTVNEIRQEQGLEAMEGPWTDSLFIMGFGGPVALSGQGGKEAKEGGEATVSEEAEGKDEIPEAPEDGQWSEELTGRQTGKAAPPESGHWVTIDGRPVFIESTAGEGGKKPERAMKPSEEDWTDTTGDVVSGDTIEFKEAVFGGSFRKPKYLGERTVVARVTAESYGEEKQQHTFSLEIISSEGYEPLTAGLKTRRKGRNIYRHGTRRLRWKDEAERGRAAEEKHGRGGQARAAREARQAEEETSRSGNEGRSCSAMLDDLRKFRRKCLKALEAGKPVPLFEPTALPPSFMARFRKALAMAEEDKETARWLLDAAVEEMKRLQSRGAATEETPKAEVALAAAS